MWLLFTHAPKHTYLLHISIAMFSSLNCLLEKQGRPCPPACYQPPTETLALALLLTPPTRHANAGHMIPSKQLQSREKEGKNAITSDGGQRINALICRWHLSFARTHARTLARQRESVCKLHFVKVFCPFTSHWAAQAVQRRQRRRQWQRRRHLRWFLCHVVWCRSQSPIPPALPSESVTFLLAALSINVGKWAWQKMEGVTCTSVVCCSLCCVVPLPLCSAACCCCCCLCRRTACTWGKKWMARNWRKKSA